MDKSKSINKMSLGEDFGQSFDNITMEQSNESVESKNHDENDDDNDENRDTWTGKLDFLLSCLGYAVGLGNVWRFPYMCYDNGGGAFLIPYIIFMLLVGMPLFLMELGIGQFCSQGPLTCWLMSPLFKGLGVAMLIVTSYLSIYYNVIIAWCLWYLGASLTSELPWASCGYWSTQFCETNYKLVTVGECSSLGGVGNTTLGICQINGTFYGAINQTLATANHYGKISMSQDYLNQVSLGVNYSPGIWDIGAPRWDLVLALLGAWIIVFLCLFKGVKSSGKVVYFTALFPYVVLIILFIQGFSEDGYQEGIKYYLIPDLNRLKETKVWKDAASQIFFSLSCGFGGLITLSSYNKFKNNIIRDTLIVTIGNSLTSIFAGFVIFSYLGILAKNLNVPVSDVASSGLSLAFVVYPQAVTYMPVPPVWSVLFFLMLLTLGLDSQFALVETITTCIIDQFKVKKPWKVVVLIGTCCIGFLIGLSMTTPGGIYVLTLLDHYAGGWNVLLIGLLELICVGYIYGNGVFCNDIEAMIGRQYCCSCSDWRIFQWWWRINWVLVAPCLLLFTLVFSFIHFENAQYGHEVLPLEYNAIGWAMTIIVALSIVITPMVMVVKNLFFKNNDESPMSLIKPSRYWGPVKTADRQYVHDNYNENIVVSPKLNEGVINNGFMLSTKF